MVLISNTFLVLVFQKSSRENSYFLQMHACNPRLFPFPPNYSFLHIAYFSMRIVPGLRLSHYNY